MYKISFFRYNNRDFSDVVFRDELDEAETVAAGLRQLKHISGVEVVQVEDERGA